MDPKYLPEDLKHYTDLEKEAREKGPGIWGRRIIYKIRERVYCQVTLYRTIY